MTTTATRTPSAPSPAAPARRASGGLRITLVVIGAILAFVGFNTVLGGAVLAAFDSRHGDDGFFTARPGRFATQTHAISSATLDLSATGPDALYDSDLLGQVRVSAASTTGKPVFIGVARTTDVAAYLGGVAHEEIDETDLGLFGVAYSARPGGAPSGAPTAQDFWAASATGTGDRTMTWSVEPGDWTVVLMNADGSAGVGADGTAGITLPALHPIIVVSLVAGGTFLVGGLAMILAATVIRRRAA